MGTYTFNEFAENLEYIFGQNTEPRTASLVNSGTTNMYKDWTNQAYQDITTRHKFFDMKKRFYFPELETDTTRPTQDGLQYIDTPTDCLYVEELYDETNDVHLSWITWDKYIGYTDRSDTTTESNPTEWHRRGGYIYLHKTPDEDDETIRIYYRKKITLLSATTDTTEIGDEWDEPILMLAAVKGFMWTKDWNAYKVFKDEWKEMVKDRITVYTPEEKARKEFFRGEDAYMTHGYKK